MTAPADTTQGLPPSRWTVHEAQSDDDAELMNLFEQVFGHSVPLDLWRWKYADAPTRGIALRRQGAIVAFYGGMPRVVQGPDRLYAAVQNGDVMVRPDERGVFTRKGAIYQVTAAYLERFIGPGRAFDFGYGFPNVRAFGVAALTGLYIQGDQLRTLSWSPFQSALPFWLIAQALDNHAMPALDRLWAATRRDWHGLFIPVRDAARWSHRYARHPSRSYRTVLLRRRLLGTPVAALALREHDAHIEWLDYAGPRSALPHAVKVARNLAALAGNKPLTALCSESIAGDFAIDAAANEPSNIKIPLRAPEPGWDQPYPWQNKLWLMGGDTDFL